MSCSSEHIFIYSDDLTAIWQNQIVQSISNCNVQCVIVVFLFIILSSSVSPPISFFQPNHQLFGLQQKMWKPTSWVWAINEAQSLGNALHRVGNQNNIVKEMFAPEYIDTKCSNLKLDDFINWHSYVPIKDKTIDLSKISRKSILS